jgi:predicted N-acetyltransferase YhbS
MHVQLQAVGHASSHIEGAPLPFPALAINPVFSLYSTAARLKRAARHVAPATGSAQVLKFVPIATVDPAAVEELLDRAFGRDRHGRTAYRLRDGVATIPGLSFAAIEDDALVGTIQCWPVALTGDDDRDHALVLVGPVAVEPNRQRSGLGKELMHHSLDAALESGEDSAMMLIGDPEYYERFFGFAADATAGWRLPGPVERHRLLARGMDVPAVAGSLGPRVALAA